MNLLFAHPVGHDPVHFRNACQPDRWKALENMATSRGHFVFYHAANEADVVVFDSAVRRLCDGTESPYDWPLLERVLERNLPVVFFDYFDYPHRTLAWSWDEMLSNQPLSLRFHWWIAQLRAREDRILYFNRSMQSSRVYPPWMVPNEFPLFLDEPLASRDEYLARPLDVCSWANEGHKRAQSFLGILRAEALRCELVIIPHYRRIPHAEWIERHRRARFFVEADAGQASTRPQYLSTVAAQIRTRTHHQLPVPWTDMVNCVEVGDPIDGWISDEDREKLKAVLADPDLLYRIYESGAGFMRENYSVEAVSMRLMHEIEAFHQRLAS